MTTIRCVRGTAEELDQLGPRLEASLDGERPCAIFVFASPKAPLDRVLGTLSARFESARVIGSSTSGEFTQEGDGSGTVAVLALAGDYRIFTGLGRGLSTDPEKAVRDALAGQPGSVHEYAYRTGVLLLDPMAGRSEEAALVLASLLGDAPLVGGAAGDDLAMAKTWVGAGTEVADDAVAVATIFSRAPLGIGVKHGHAPLSEKLTVTRADGSVVLEVDGRPAWDVWLEKTAARAKALGLDHTANPGAYLLRFEAGLKVGSSFKVRAPLAPKDGGGILFATALPEGTTFQIMESDATAQIESAVEAARLARSGLGGGGKVAGALLFDCICRKLILGDQYGPMLARVSQELGGAPLAGFETYGEIAMNATDMSGFHNTTSVVLAFPSD